MEWDQTLEDEHRVYHRDLLRQLASDTKQGISIALSDPALGADEQKMTVAAQALHDHLKTSLRQIIIGLVQCGAIEPDAAGVMVAKCGIEPFSQAPDPELFDPEREPDWTLAMAVQWIYRRDMDAVRLAWNVYYEKIMGWSPAPKKWVQEAGAEYQLGPVRHAWTLGAPSSVNSPILP